METGFDLAVSSGSAVLVLPARLFIRVSLDFQIVIQSGEIVMWLIHGAGNPSGNIIFPTWIPQGDLS